MGWLSLGKVAPSSSGTPIRATSNLAASTSTSNYNTDGKPRQEYAPCMTMIVEALAANTGKVYIGLSGFTKSSTGAGQKLFTLPAPSTTLWPYIEISIPGPMGAINAADYYIDVDNSGEGCDISILTN